MRVKELIEFLKQHDPDMRVVHLSNGLYELLRADDMCIKRAGEVQPDGFGGFKVPFTRPDEPQKPYLLLPWE